MIDLTGGPCVYKRLSGCGSGTEYLAVTPWGDFYPCHQFVGEEQYLMGMWTRESQEPRSEAISENVMYIQSHPARTVLQDSTAVADAQQMVIISIKISVAIMKSDANSRGSVWSAPS